MTLAVRENPDADASRVGAWMRQVRESGWVSLVIATLLTALMASFAGGKVHVETLAVLYCINLLIALSIGTVMSFSYTVVIPRLELERRPFVLRWLVHSLVVCALVAVGVEAGLRMAAVVFTETVTKSYPRSAVIQVALPIAIVVLVMSIAYEQQKKRVAAEQAKSQEAVRQLLAKELEALAARTNPHFLFNSLNTVASLIPDDPVQAEQAVLDLAALLRYTLDSSRRRTVTLGEELDIIDRYLAFEKRRHGARLVVETRVDDDLKDVRVPPLLLQPLVENAVNHGLSTHREGHVRIEVCRSGERLLLRVEDDGPGPQGSRHTGSGTSQTDLRERLELYYRGTAELSTRRSSLGGFCAELELPLEPAAYEDRP